MNLLLLHISRQRQGQRGDTVICLLRCYLFIFFPSVNPNAALQSHLGSQQVQGPQILQGNDFFSVHEIHRRLQSGKSIINLHPVLPSALTTSLHSPFFSSQLQNTGLHSNGLSMGLQMFLDAFSHSSCPGLLKSQSFLCSTLSAEHCLD